MNKCIYEYNQCKLVVNVIDTREIRTTRPLHKCVQQHINIEDFSQVI
jgi:hypothetical protein